MPATTSEAAGSPPENVRTLRILIVDDSETTFTTLHLLLKRIARESGRVFQVEHATDVERGLERIRDGVDLALVDYALGNERGTDFIRTARAAGALCAIVMITASGVAEAEAEAAEAGANDFLLKYEITEASLDRTIRYALRNAGMQARLMQLNATLEDRVAAALAEQRRAEEALRHAEKMDAVRRATSVLAHDFRNILTAVVGTLEYLGDRVADDPRAAKVVASGLRAGEVGQRLINDLMAFAHRQPRRPSRVRPEELVRGMVESAQRTLGPKLTLALDVDPDSGPISVDAAELQRALLNLLANARDATPDGGTVSLSVAPASRGGERWVRLAVVDRGRGMSAATLKQALEPFFTTKPRGSGTGLSQVNELVRESGGRLELMSSPGNGTVVELWFPEA